MRNSLESLEPEQLFWLIPIVLIGYIFLMNLAPLGQNQVYMIDVGSESDTSGIAQLEDPESRISDRLSEENISYRNLQGSLVYFAVAKPSFLSNSTELEVELRFEESVPDGKKFMIGAKDSGSEWSYNWDTIYTENADTIRRIEDLSFERKNGWMTARASWNGSEIYISGEKLNFVTSAGFLKNRDKGLKVDEIKVTVEREPLWKRY